MLYLYCSIFEMYLDLPSFYIFGLFFYGWQHWMKYLAMYTCTL